MLKDKVKIENLKDILLKNCTPYAFKRQLSYNKGLGLY